MLYQGLWEMGMNRRTFIDRVLAAIGALALVSFGFIERFLPEKTAKTIKKRIFPGRVRPLSELDIDSQGPWAG